MYRVELEPGLYSVRFELSGFARTEVPQVEVLLGRTFMVNGSLKVGSVSEAVQVTAEAAPLIDLTSATVTHSLTAEQIDRMPKARSFQGLALTAPGVNQGEIEGGFQVHGASGAENSYTVDGVTTNSVLYGSSRQDTVFEYLQEVQVKTTGINAEYGGALGGVISAVTKSGGNIYSGEVHEYFSGSAISGGPVQRLSLDPIDDTTVRNVQDNEQSAYRNEIGGSLGGPIMRDKLFFFASYSPRFVRRTNEYLFSSGTDPGEIKQEQTLTQLFGKVNYARSGHQIGGSILMTPVRSTGNPIAYNGTIPDAVISSKAANEVSQTRGFDMDQTNASGFGDFTLGNSNLLSVRGGMFYDNYKDTGVPQTTSYTYQRSAIGVPGVPVSLQQPNQYFNTPRIQISNQDMTRRTFFQGDFTRAFSGAGSHNLKAGMGYQRTTNDVDTAYPGGYVYLYWGESFTSPVTGTAGRGTYGYYRVDDIGTFGAVSGDIISMYVQDSWQVNSRLTVNLGLRTERERVPTFSPEVQKYAYTFGFGDKMAPRLSAAYDVRGDGRVKVAASWGRYFDWTKYELSRGSFIGDVNGVRWGDRWKIYYRELNTLDLDSLSLNNMPGRDLWGSSTGFRDLRLSHIEDIDPDVKPMFQDSFNASVEFQVGPRTVFGAYYIHNDLGRTIEDFGAIVEGDSVYRIGNPGEGSATLYPSSFPDVYGDFPMPKPKRQYDALELTLNRRFSSNWFAGASYTLSRLYGNYSGLANSDEISTPTTNVSSSTAQQLGGSIARPGSNAHIGWDSDIMLWDAQGNYDPQGRLATDRPHVVKLFGSYLAPFGTTIGGFFYGGSGTPISTVVNEVNTLYRPFVNGRGDMGRTPFLTRTDLLVSHDIQLADSRRIRLEANFINLFNQKTATHIFNFLNKGAPGGGSTLASAAIDLSETDITKPYDYNQLIRQTPLGQNAFDPRYGREDLWNPGLQGQFAVKFIF
jgi:hypothetical protein